MKRKNPPDIQALFEQRTPIENALKKAAREARLRHKQAGNPVAEWRDGKVVWIPPDQIDVK